MFEETKKNYALVNTLVKAINDKETTELSKFLGVRIAHPETYTVMLGETSSGKTTVINGLLGKNLLFTSVRPSTAAIVELEFIEDNHSISYYAINKDATMEKLSVEQFIECSKNPDDTLNRLRLKTSSRLHGMGSLRLFDTPGYGSLLLQHEEVLTNFLPESDVVLYTVSYKVGIQQDDFTFLNQASELIGESVKNKETEFVLVINRTPEHITKNDRRVKEITSYVSDILHYIPEVFLIPSVVCEEGQYPLPAAPELWNHVQTTVTSQKNIIRLEKSLNGYVVGLLEKCESIINSKIFAHKATVDEKEFMQKKVADIKKTNQEIKNKLIEPYFNDLIGALPSVFSRAKSTIISQINDRIDTSDTMRGDEVMAFVNNHMLQFETKKQVDEINLYIRAKLDELDREIRDRLNKEYAEIQKEVELHFSVAAATMAKNMFKNIGGTVMQQSLLGYFSQFAGRGGTGIANGAKHLLKKIGDAFGHTFSRETHNTLARVLSKIGATSAKAVGFAVTVVIETITIIADILTWQGKLKKAVEKGTQKWYDEVVALVKEDLLKLKQENIRLLDEETNNWIKEFSAEKAEETDDDVENLQILLEKTKQEMGV